MKTIAELTAAMQAVVDLAEAETRSLTTDEVETYEALEAELHSAQKTDEVTKRHEARKSAIIGMPAVIRATPKGDDALEFAFGQYLRTGQANADLSQHFAQTVGTDSAGGYSVPSGSLARLTEARTAFGGFANLADSITTATGNPIAWPSVPTAALSTSADIAAEGAASAAGADIVFGEVALGAYKYAATGTGNVPIKVSVELLQDAAFDVQAFVMKRLGERIARKQAYDLVRGSGSGAPLGIMAGTAGDVETASGSVPTYAKLNTLKHALDPVYRPNASFILNDTTLGVLEGLLDGNNRPILVDSTQGIEGSPSAGRLLGYPYHVVQEVANLANDVQGIGFGDWREAYIVRNVKDVQVLVNPYAATGYVVYDAWARMDGTVQNAAAYVTMEGKT